MSVTEAAFVAFFIFSILINSLSHDCPGLAHAASSSPLQPHRVHEQDARTVGSAHGGGPGLPRFFCNRFSAATFQLNSKDTGASRRAVCEDITFLGTLGLRRGICSIDGQPPGKCRPPRSAAPRTQREKYVNVPWKVSFSSEEGEEEEKRERGGGGVDVWDEPPFVPSQGQCSSTDNVDHSLH